MRAARGSDSETEIEFSVVLYSRITAQKTPVIISAFCAVLQQIMYCYARFPAGILGATCMVLAPLFAV